MTFSIWNYSVDPRGKWELVFVFVVLHTATARADVIFTFSSRVLGSVVYFCSGIRQLLLFSPLCLHLFKGLVFIFDTQKDLSGVCDPQVSTLQAVWFYS